jgi:hypothetical protein
LETSAEMLPGTVEHPASRMTTATRDVPSKEFSHRERRRGEVRVVTFTG